MTLADCLLAFFEYWTVGHNYRDSVASIRVPGGFVYKADKDWTKRVGTDRHLICVEDPFELAHDLGRVVDK